MIERPPLPKSELEVARVVWELQRATVRQVLDALPPERGLDFKTVQTYLRRLEGKGYLRVEREGRSNVYCPRVKPVEVVREVVNDFVRSLFGGEPLPLFQHFLQSDVLSKDELRQLRQLVEQAEEREKHGTKDRNA